jgi:hypothetical protein
MAHGNTPTVEEVDMGFERECALCTFVLNYAENIIKDIPEAEMNRPGAAGANPPAWIVGHLASVGDFALQMLGKPSRIQKAWHKQFAPKNTPATDAVYPPKAELVTALLEVYRAAIDAAHAADPSTMPQPHGLGILEGSAIKTKAELVSHLLTTHLAGHVGQLSYWRRCSGRGPLF